MFFIKYPYRIWRNELLILNRPILVASWFYRVSFGPRVYETNIDIEERWNIYSRDDQLD